MRRIRILSTVVAMVAALLLAFSSVGAQANPSHVVAKQKPLYSFTFKHNRVNRTTFRIYGTVHGYKGKPVYLQKGKTKNGPWKTYQRPKTSKSSGFYQFKRVSAWHGGTNNFRMVIPGNSSHRTTTHRFSITRS
ncbi:MAG: hypothetical protein FWE71_05670 [Nocardioidaceae bacterium]|nr:hypothetical protein [Nocardioidaceae bacterium]MCL2613553.1 hypothetical protein [Nocardioidaceae bacterium]